MSIPSIFSITLEYPPEIGGIATYVHELGVTLSKESFAVLAPPQKESARFDATVPYQVIRRPLLFPSWVWPRWLRLLFVLLPFLRRKEIRLIMIHHLLPVGYVAFIVKKLFGIPYIVFSHGTDFIKSTSSPWKRKLAGIVLGEARGVVTNSLSLEERYISVFPHVQGKTVVIYPCPSPQFFDAPPVEYIEKLRTQYGLDGKKVILSVSRLGEGKGFPQLLRLFPDLLNRFPHLVWMIVGEGEKQDQILREMHDLGVQNAIRFVGSVPHAQLAPYYYLADWFVLLTHPDVTRGEEAFGLVFLEAAAAGLPIVAGKSGGVEEAVLHGVTGIIVDTKKEGGVLESIEEVIQEPVYAKRLGAAARERAMSDFVWAHQLEKLKPWLVD